MDRWHQLLEILKSILKSNNVYFQPPSNIRMKYPCIIFRRESDSTIKADDIRYRSLFRYSIMYIRRDIDSTDICEKIMDLPLCSYDRFYVADGLNHDVFSIYF